MQNGLLVIIMLISNHKSLAEQLVAADVTAVLKKCLSLSRPETMLAIIALNHISMVHKLESKGRSHDPRCQLTVTNIVYCSNNINNKRCEEVQTESVEVQRGADPQLTDALRQLSVIASQTHEDFLILIDY